MFRNIVALLAAALILSQFFSIVVNAEGRDEYFVSIEEVLCRPTDVRDSPISLVYGTVLWATDPPIYSEDGMSQMVSIASPYYGRANSCWLEFGAFDPGTGWIFWDGYDEMINHPSFEPIGEIHVNTDNVLCHKDLTEDSEIYATLNEGALITMLDDGLSNGWQYVITSDENGDHFGCYVQEVFLGGETASELVPNTEIQPDNESWTTVEEEASIEEVDVITVGTVTLEEPSESPEEAGSVPAESEDMVPVDTSSKWQPVTALPSTGVGTFPSADQEALGYVVLGFLAAICCFLWFCFVGYKEHQEEVNSKASHLLGRVAAWLSRRSGQ